MNKQIIKKVKQFIGTIVTLYLWEFWIRHLIEATNTMTATQHLINIFPFMIIATIAWLYYINAMKWQHIRTIAINFLSKYRAKLAYKEINKPFVKNVANFLEKVPMPVKIDEEEEKFKLREFLQDKDIRKKDIDTLIKELYEKSL